MLPETKKAVICGLPLLLIGGTYYHEHEFYQKLTLDKSKEYFQSQLEMAQKVQERFNYPSTEDAFIAMLSADEGTQEDPKIRYFLQWLMMGQRMQETIDTSRLEALTYLINSRLIWGDFDAEDFEKKYGVETTETWTIEHTKAIYPMFDELYQKFFAVEFKLEGKT